MRIFCDANVLFAAALSPDGRSAALIERAAEGGHVLLASPHAIEEARRNLVRKEPGSIERFEVVLGGVDRVPEAPPSLVERAAREGLPDTDAPILAAAIAAGADVLVTGDRRHFGELFGTTIDGTEILSLAQTLSRLLRS